MKIDLYEILYVDRHYPRKPLPGFLFIAFWCLVYLAMTAAGCAYLWVTR